MTDTHTSRKSTLKHRAPALTLPNPLGGDPPQPPKREEHDHQTHEGTSGPTNMWRRPLPQRMPGSRPTASSKFTRLSSAGGVVPVERWTSPAGPRKCESPVTTCRPPRRRVQRDVSDSQGQPTLGTFALSAASP